MTTSEPLITQAGDGVFVVDGKAEIDDVADKIGDDFAAGEHGEYVDTIGGMIFNTLGRVPARGEVVQAIPGFEFHVLDADPRRVKRVRIVHDPKGERRRRMREQPGLRPFPLPQRLDLRRRPDTSGPLILGVDGMERLAGRIILLWGWRRALAAFLAGAVAVLAQAPFDFFAAGFVAFPVLVWLLDGASAEARRSAVGAACCRRFAVGWWFGFGYFVAGLWWIGSALLVDADSFAWAIAARGGRHCRHARRSSMACGLRCGAARSGPSDIGRIAALAAAFAAAEWLRGFLFTGFPWNPIGYGVMPAPLLMQSVAVVGMHRHERACRVRVRHAGFACRRDSTCASASGLPLCWSPPMSASAIARLAAPRSGPPAKVLAVRIVQPAVDSVAEMGHVRARSHLQRDCSSSRRIAGRPGSPSPR